MCWQMRLDAIYHLPLRAYLLVTQFYLRSSAVRSQLTRMTRRDRARPGNLDRGLAHAPIGPMGRESGHPAGRAGRAPPALSRLMATEWTPALHEWILTSGVRLGLAPGRSYS
jgi:hypothetical protein